MPPFYDRQGAAIGSNGSPFETGSESSFSSVSGSALQSSGYHSNRPAESSKRHMSHRSVNHSHPDPIHPPNYSTAHGSTGKITGAYGLSQRPSLHRSPSQSSSSQHSSNPAPRLLHPPSPEKPSRGSEYKPAKPSSHIHGESSFQPQSSRAVYLPQTNGSSSQKQGGTSAASHRHPEITPPLVKAPFRASANVAHPSHYRQSKLQFSSTPNTAAPPTSKFQIVVPSNPANFYGMNQSVTNTGPYLSDGPLSSPIGGRSRVSEPRQPNTLPKKRGRPFSNKAPVKSTPKKRGHPFKTLGSELKAKARASSSGTSTPSAYKKKGPAVKVRHQAFIPQPEPVFYAFKCEWKGCVAELHNLETLRRHIHILHKKRDDGNVPCLWAKCGAKKVVEGEDGEKKVVDEHPLFASRHEWKEHLETSHLIPFSWHMGDGPKGTDLSGKAKGIINPAWLIDENGNEVTPSVQGQALEEGSMNELNKQRFRKMRGMNIFREKAEIQDLKSMSGGMGMLPPQVSSDDDESTGDDEAEPSTGDGDSEVVDEGRGMPLVVRLGNDEVKDSDEESDGDEDDSDERGEDMDDEGDVQMARI